MTKIPVFSYSAQDNRNRLWGERQVSTENHNIAWADRDELLASNGSDSDEQESGEISFFAGNSQIVLKKLPEHRRSREILVKRTKFPGESVLFFDMTKY